MAPDANIGDEAMSGFGIARLEESGTSSHELIYEHKYFPSPVRELSAIELMVPANGVVLRPAVRNGKVDFRFFGNRVPLSADHARCWMGHLLQAEVQKGTLAHVEFVLRRHQELLDFNVDGPMHPRQHGPQPSWLWDVWSADPNAPAMASGRMGRPGVEVLMRMSANNGMSLELFCTEEAPLTAVYRVLKQYCDDDAAVLVWRPIPDPPASKVLSRECSSDVRRRRLMGLPVTESSAAVLKRSLNDWDAAETVLVQAVSCAQAAHNSADFKELLFSCSEVRDALEAAARVRLKPRSEWTEPMTAVLEALLRRSSENSTDGFLADAVEMTNSLRTLGIRSPDNLPTPEQA